MSLEIRKKKDVKLTYEHMYMMERGKKIIDFGIIYKNLVDLYSVAKLITKCPCRILDIGCGSGRISLLLAKEGHEVIGVDLSVEGIKSGIIDAKNEILLNIDFIVADFEHLPFKNSIFDLAISFGTFEYVNKLEKPLIEINRILRKNGRIIFDIWHKFGLKLRIFTLELPFYLENLYFDLLGKKEERHYPILFPPHEHKLTEVRKIQIPDLVFERIAGHYLFRPKDVSLYGAILRKMGLNPLKFILLLFRLNKKLTTSALGTFLSSDLKVIIRNCRG